ncbi:MAG: hypothetical protein U0I98_06050 [Oscillospiraceae bacterium]|jgi:hypothetical protein|nr:hypothetical protein [Oscillospiraceae bacterium]
MDFFKKPAVAVILSLIVIFASTLISVSAKLNNKCDKVTDGFYSGVRYKGENHDAIAEEISSLCAVTDEIVPIASNYGIDTAALSDSSQRLRALVSSGSRDIGSVYQTYSEFITALKDVEAQLHATGLSSRHEEAMSEYSDEIADCVDDINTACYNDSVREFLRKYDKFPTRNWADFLGVSFPEYFS